MFIATIKTCTDEQTIIQRLFSKYERAAEWLDMEFKAWMECHPEGKCTINQTDLNLKVSRLVHWVSSDSKDEVFYFISELNPDDPNSEFEWA